MRRRPGDAKRAPTRAGSENGPMSEERYGSWGRVAGWPGGWEASRDEREEREWTDERRAIRVVGEDPPRRPHRAAHVGGRARRGDPPAGSRGPRHDRPLP